ncbi:GntR family transcriptional regulator [Oceanithermus sp.]|uniref:GntR family transcriptional regulator n=1 Tax=Oceanithermus sp. TaxID=2268145 RepID=UPI00257AD470|nr:GntR family transcriptional regulator [Oceanithermus sp.]
MKLRVDPEAGPIFEQIAEGVAAAVARGALEPGAKLPSARALAEELRVNPNTVIRAFELLEREGITETRRGLGTYIRPDVDVDALRSALLQKAARRYLAEVRALGLDLREASEALKEVEDAP